MEAYAKEKLSHKFHHFSQFPENTAITAISLPPETTVRRKKRDGGITTAILSGIIGMTTKTLSDLTAYRPIPSTGGCKWFGTAPFCNYHCPPDYDYIRSHNGRCSSLWLASQCSPDDSFGEPCTTILGSHYKKRFCCKSDPKECTWSGRWMGANTAHNAYCRYDNNVGQCGALTCFINHYSLKALDRSEIEGNRCDELKMFNLTGYATCGFIAWFDSENVMVNSWYKTDI
ncbi:hypothetical protein DdX_03355 [Ditylenchus destructor]|uniref:Uncharacterized protein n=1 Tax=Ditylenchus destructor TaxID=166010 RepID=A0AAD4R6U4_9BILA|nr:hypothetical protein DdX_03355 [Ditylenchus destructor]